MKKTKVMLGLSGGVDSAVSCYLLKKQGYDVAAGFMRNWDSYANNDYLGNPNRDDAFCPQEIDYLDAKAVADKLCVPLFRIDFIKEYWDYVFQYFLDEYKKGRTPNPDLFCNKFIKFETFRSFAHEQGYEYIAMGHYAKKVIDENGVHIYKAKDTNKDQTYFLSQINKEQLKEAIFPLGDITKEEVRKIAKELNLESVKDKKDSTGICFIGERNFKQFLNNYLPSKKGNIIDMDSKRIIGKHEGVLYYTLGQRKGLGIGGIKDVPSGSWFVVAKDVKNNILYVSQGDENKYLLSDKAIISHVNLFEDKNTFPEIVGVKFRYRQKDHLCKLRFLPNGDVELTYSPYKAVTPGQAAVFYDGDKMLGGGIIEKIFYNDEEKRVY